MGFTVCHITLSSNLIFKITHTCAHTRAHAGSTGARRFSIIGSEESARARLCGVIQPQDPLCTPAGAAAAPWSREQSCGLAHSRAPPQQSSGSGHGRGVKQRDQVPGRAAMCAKPTPLSRAASRHQRDRPRGSAGLPLRMPAPSRTCDLPSKPKGGGHT